MSERHTCPSRAEIGRSSGEGMDGWSAGHGLIGQARGCTYCGSMHPDDFMAAVRDGKTVGPTDKNYKAYLNETLSDEDKANRRTAEIARLTGAGMSDTAAAEYVDTFLPYTEGASIGKFYYQHLSEAQKDEFIELVNNHTMRIGYPGHFYRLPYFAAPKA